MLNDDLHGKINKSLSLETFEFTASNLFNSALSSSIASESTGVIVLDDNGDNNGDDHGDDHDDDRGDDDILSCLWNPICGSRRFESLQ